LALWIQTNSAQQNNQMRKGIHIMNPDLNRNFPTGNAVSVGSAGKTTAKRLQHIDQSEGMLWIFVAVLLLATIAAGFIFWLKTGL
jgi:hypothetical protein